MYREYLEVDLEKPLLGGVQMHYIVIEEAVSSIWCSKLTALKTSERHSSEHMRCECFHRTLRHLKLMQVSVKVAAAGVCSATSKSKVFARLPPTGLCIYWADQTIQYCFLLMDFSMCILIFLVNVFGIATLMLQVCHQCFINSIFRWLLLSCFRRGNAAVAVRLVKD